MADYGSSITKTVDMPTKSNGTYHGEQVRDFIEALPESIKFNIEALALVTAAYTKVIARC